MLNVAVMLLLAAGCGDSPSVVNHNMIEVNTGAINLSIVETVGNNSYIPLNLDSSTYSSRKLILNVMKKFEDENPDLEVMSWGIDAQQRAYSTSAHVFGLLAHHRPRQK